VLNFPPFDRDLRWIYYCCTRILSIVVFEPNLSKIQFSICFRRPGNDWPFDTWQHSVCVSHYVMNYFILALISDSIGIGAYRISNTWVTNGFYKINKYVVPVIIYIIILIIPIVLSICFLVPVCIYTYDYIITVILISYT